MKPSVVICGSYHKDPTSLQRIFRELEATGCRILSPISIDFLDTDVEIVRTSHESDFSILELEKFHLRAIRSADFVWLHLPDGHVGLSGSFEVGFANALGKPVFCYGLPSDAMLREMVTSIKSVFEALESTSLV